MLFGDIMREKDFDIKTLKKSLKKLKGFRQKDMLVQMIFLKKCILTRK